MFTATIIGHFAWGHQRLDGQTIKTHNIYCALKESIGDNEVNAVDTYGGVQFLLKLPIILLKVLYTSKNIVILPAQRGVKIISPLLLLYNCIFKRKIHYIVIGGWLYEMASQSKMVKYCIQKFDAIYVETQNMQTALQSLNINNVIIMPNFKNIPIRNIDEIQKQVFGEPYHLCTFSRVSREKGIEIAIEAVKHANTKLGRVAYHLDIYGQIEDEKDWFIPLMSQQPQYIQYKGLVSANDSVNVLSHYFMLLFPTFYAGEGLAGTLIDAMCTGLPVIATDWHNNNEIITHGSNGFLVPIQDSESIANILCDIAISPNNLLSIREHCIQYATRYLPQNIIPLLINRFYQS